MKNTAEFVELTKRGNKLAKRFARETSLCHYLSILEGNNRGKVYVNSASDPSFAAVYSYLYKGFQIMGSPIIGTDEYVALRMLFEKELIPKLLKNEHVGEVSYSCDTEALLENMHIAFFDKEQYEQEYCLYTHRPGSPMPAFEKTEYKTLRITKEFIENNAEFSLVLRDEILRSYASIDAFLKQGLGYVALDGERIIANLISSGSYEKSIVLGADTDSEYRCRKIAASLLRSAQCYADEHGLSLVWECNKDNIASVGTAEKCGLERRFTYPVRWFELK